MDRKEKVMKRLQEHYNYLKQQGHEIIFLAHQGSYNYNLDYEKSYGENIVITPVYSTEN